MAYESKLIIWYKIETIKKETKTTLNKRLVLEQLCYS